MCCIPSRAAGVSTPGPPVQLEPRLLDHPCSWSLDSWTTLANTRGACWRWSMQKPWTRSSHSCLTSFARGCSCSLSPSCKKGDRATGDCPHQATGLYPATQCLLRKVPIYWDKQFNETISIILMMGVAIGSLLLVTCTTTVPP